LDTSLLEKRNEARCQDDAKLREPEGNRKSFSKWSQTNAAIPFIQPNCLDFTTKNGDLQKEVGALASLVAAHRVFKLSSAGAREEVDEFALFEKFEGRHRLNVSKIAV